MSAKEICFEEEARDYLKQGVKELADAVKATLGPEGYSVGLETPFGPPSITNDGAAIAKEISFKEKKKNLGAYLAKEVAAKVKESSGDGTTTSIVLLNALIEAGLKVISAGASPIFVKRGMDAALQVLLKEIEKQGSKISTKEEIEKLATASSNSSAGKLIAEAFEKVGTGGVVVIEEGKKTFTELEHTEGLQFDRGFISHYLCNNQEKMTIEYKNPLVLITDKKILTAQELLPILEHVASIQRPLLIIADDLEGDALSTLVVNQMRGTLQVAAVKAPSFGNDRKALLEDFALLTNGTFITEELGYSLKEATADLLGSVEYVKVTKESTTLTCHLANKEKIEARVKEIEHAISTATTTYEKEKLEKRRAKLLGGVAVINVGAMTEPEMKREKNLFEDALAATKAALAEGVTLGGGLALYRAAKALDHIKLAKEEMLGAEVLKKGCKAPLKQLISNAGFDPELIISEIEKSDEKVGFDALTGNCRDMEKAGILDPVKVVKNCIIHAVSGSGVAFLTEAIMTPDD